jgi:hypothetical protein
MNSQEQYEYDVMLYIMLVQNFLEMVRICYAFFMIVSHSSIWLYENETLRQRIVDREGLRGEFLESLINRDDITCVNQLRMDIRSFRLLCGLLRTEGKLKEDGLVSVEEQVAMFLHILAHHSKNRVIKFLFKRSGQTVSKYFNSVLNGVIRLHEILLSAPDPVLEDCSDERWKLFKVLC